MEEDVFGTYSISTQSLDFDGLHGQTWKKSNNKFYCLTDALCVCKYEQKKSGEFVVVEATKRQTKWNE